MVRVSLSDALVALYNAPVHLDDPVGMVDQESALCVDSGGSLGMPVQAVATPRDSTTLYTRLALASVAAVLALGSVHPTLASDEVQSVAAEAGVSPDDLAGASATTGLPPREYLERVGELAIPVPDKPAGWPIGGQLGQRIYCIESLESHHGMAMWNPTPVGREHAQGWLGFLPSTAAHWSVQIGNRDSEWRGAAEILAQGERFARTQFYGVGAGIC